MVGRPVAVVAAVQLVVLLALAGRYGFHRDELYFLEAGRHIALGYVDQPPLVAYLARAQTALFGDSVVAIRVVPALVSAVSVVLAGVLARELGGGRRAQVVAAAAVGAAGFVLAIGHLLSTATFDFAFWMAGIVLATRMLRTGDARLWLGFGVVAGLALWNKHLVVLLAVALVVALAIERRRDLLRPRWLLVGAAVASVLAAPTLWWQATNGWPQLEMAGALADRIGGENRAMLLPLQVLLLGPFLLPLLVAGIRWLYRRAAGGAVFRPLLWAYVAALVLTFVSGGRPYYPLPLAAAVVVAGVVAWEHRAPRRAVGLVVATVAVSLPLSLPVLPVDVLAWTPIGEINDTQVEQIGWPELVDQVAEVVAALPVADGEVVILAGTYGEAGALDRYGAGTELPEVYSGHNAYWHWRRPTDDDATVVAVRMHQDTLARHFTECGQAGTVDIGLGIENEVYGHAIHVCRGLRGTWAEVWPELRHYN